MSSISFPRLRLRLRRDFVYRIVLVAIFVVFAHPLEWTWLRFLTSEAVLRMSSALGFSTARLSFDTIRVNGAIFQYIVACTLVDVVLGSIPLLWDLQRSIKANLVRVVGMAAAFLAFNIVRLEISQVLYRVGLTWTLADQVLGGVAYFTIWIALWNRRTWRVLEELTPDFWSQLVSPEQTHPLA